jgi:coiled-coil domain-containing protein 6
MMQTDSELESDTSSINDGMPPCTNQHQINIAPVQLSRDQLEKRIESLLQENRVLKIEIDTFKMRVKSLQEENRELRKNSVSIQVSD